jgi:hypothetical protein
MLCHRHSDSHAPARRPSTVDRRLGDLDAAHVTAAELGRRLNPAGERARVSMSATKAS